MTQLASVSLVDRIAIITLDNPPVNALSAPLRVAVMAALLEAFDDPNCDAVVLIGAGKSFIAGADIAELGKPAAPPTFAELQDTIEHGPKPVIAAIHGTALGGGFEIALACHYRIADWRARVGLPEVTLGILPGAGGTQRVPRLAGVEAALEIMTSGRHVPAAEALELGLIDQVVKGNDLRSAAVAFARDVVMRGAARPKSRDREDRIALARGRPELFEAFTRANAPRFKDSAAPGAIVELVRAAVELPFEEGLRQETRLFEPLVASTESAARRHVFFAERAASRVPDLPADTPVLDIRKVGVIGAGTMGGGITMNFLNAGIPVTLAETSQAALDRGIGVIRRNYEASARKGRLTMDQVEERMALISLSLDLDGLGDADLIVEAVYESMDVKAEIFARLDRIARPGAILASNTSFLDLNRIAQATRRPEWVIGLHFFSPANVMRLVEVVRGSATASPAIATAMKLARRIGKVPVLSGVCDGFIANRLMAPRGYQAEAMMLEGIPIATIDNVLVDYGFAMGHFQMMDLVGLDVIGRDDSTRTVMGDLVAAGRLGQKSGAGYYDYDEQRRPAPSPLTASLIREVALAQGVARRETPDGAAVLARLLYPVVNEGARILEEGIAIRSSDIDVAAVLGYNWPVHRGGPMFWASQLGLPRVVAEMQALEAEFGEVYRPAPLLVRQAEAGRDWDDL